MLPEQLRVLVIGNSHLAALHQAYRTRQGLEQHEGLDCRFVMVNSPDWNPPVVGGQFVDKIRAELEREDLRLIVSMFGGNDHNVLGLVDHPAGKFDFILPEAPGLPLNPDAEVLPYGIVRASLGRLLKPTFQLMRRLRCSTRLPVLHLESPPPNPSEAQIRANPYGFDDPIREHGVSPASLRYKLWRLHSSLIQETCEEVRFRFVSAPRSMQDDSGMLIPPAWSDDPSHANEFYGERLYRQLLAIAARRFPVEQSVAGAEMANASQPTSVATSA